MDESQLIENARRALTELKNTENDASARMNACNNLVAPVADIQKVLNDVHLQDKTQYNPLLQEILVTHAKKIQACCTHAWDAGCKVTVDELIATLPRLKLYLIHARLGQHYLEKGGEQRKKWDDLHKKLYPQYHPLTAGERTDILHKFKEENPDFDIPAYLTNTASHIPETGAESAAHPATSHPPNTEIALYNARRELPNTPAEAVPYSRRSTAHRGIKDDGGTDSRALWELLQSLHTNDPLKIMGAYVGAQIRINEAPSNPTISELNGQLSTHILRMLQQDSLPNKKETEYIRAVATSLMMDTGRPGAAYLTSTMADTLHALAEHIRGGNARVAFMTYLTLQNIISRLPQHKRALATLLNTMSRYGAAVEHAEEDHSPVPLDALNRYADEILQLSPVIQRQ